MKLHILSDLHTEFSDFDPPGTDADVVDLAGDIGVGRGGIQWAERQYPKVPIIYVPGNHEFHGHDVRDTDRLFGVASANLRVLSDSKHELDGVRFPGSTLWTDFKPYGQGEAWFSRRRASALIEDLNSIKNGEGLFTPEDSVELHEASKAWLMSELQKIFYGTTIVVTYHLLSPPSIDSRCKNDVLNPAFASRLEDVIEQYQQDLWIHGHTPVPCALCPVPCDYANFGIRVVCNPQVYLSESSGKRLSPGLIVDL